MEPVGGTPKYTFATEQHQSTMTLQHVGSVTETMTASYSDYIFYAAHNRNRYKDMTTLSTVSLDSNGVSHAWSTTSGTDTDEWTGDTEDDPWIAGIRAYCEAFVDVLVGTVLNLAHMAADPEYAAWYVLTFPERFVGQLQQLGETIKAMVTGVDPHTGKPLTDKEYAELIGGLAGAISGALVLSYATEFAAGYLGELAGGERCSIMPWRSCFTGEMPMRLERGSIPIKEVKAFDEVGDECDLIYARSEFDPNGPVVARRVLQKFIRVAPVWNLHCGTRLIETTAEHPFFAEGKGWTPTQMLEIGDRIRLERDGWVRVDGVADSGRVETVYNLEVEDDHTYFVGSDEWGFAVWAIMLVMPSE